MLNKFQPTQQEITDYCNYSQINADCLTDTTYALTESETTLLGAVNEEKTLDIYKKKCIERKSNCKWLCKMSGKIFKRRKDVCKSIIKNYSDKLDNLKKDVN